MPVKVLLLCAFILSSAPVRAEYRVFLLKIEKTGNAAGDVGGPARFVESTLDPEQYRGYHPVAPDEVVTYLDTWRCRGRTDRRPLCPNPRQPAGQASDPAP